MKSSDRYFLIAPIGSPSKNAIWLKALTIAFGEVSPGAALRSAAVWMGLVGGVGCVCAAGLAASGTKARSAGRSNLRIVNAIFISPLRVDERPLGERRIDR